MPGSNHHPRPTVPEVALSRIWQEGRHTAEMRTTDGRRVSVIYRGVWTHALGPDFRDAYLEIGGRLIRGAVELHINASDWLKHGHQHDPAYDAVMLHAVLTDDLGQPVTTTSGHTPATLVLADFLTTPLDELVNSTIAVHLGGFGHGPCLPTLPTTQPERVRAALRRKGWERLHNKQLRFAQDLLVHPPSEVLYRGMLDALGYSSNRIGMAAVAACLPLLRIETLAPDGNAVQLLALLLGAGGFLPLSPTEQHLAEVEPAMSIQIESAWSTLRAVGVEPLAPRMWQLTRVRPLNHPIRRLASLASLFALTTQSGLLATVLADVDTAPAAWGHWLAQARPPLGSGRVRQMQTNVFAPFLAAYADATDDAALADTAHAIWEKLPGKADDAVARSTLAQIVGDARFPIRTALEEQGLHQIGRFGCASLRCFECPIAELAWHHEAPSVLPAAISEHG